jgi:hypothetical protein
MVMAFDVGTAPYRYSQVDTAASYQQGIDLRDEAIIRCGVKRCFL